MKTSSGYGQICVFGEVLFDHFSDNSRILGGAPFNVAWNLHAFDLSPCFISRVGDDQEGRQIREMMESRGLYTGALQSDSQHSTGRVNVFFKEDEPEYSILEPCAYDFIRPASATKDILSHCTLLYHGTLALRNPVSAASFSIFRQQHQGIIFLDVNLRKPWWEKKQVLAMIEQADWIKLNTEEASLLFDLEAEAEQGLIALVDRYSLQGIILTCGGQGAMAVTADKKVYSVRPNQATPLIDTVGAGDAFSSIMILGLHKRWPMQKTLERAQEFASAIVGQRGATVADHSFYNNFICQWQADLTRD